MADISSYIEKLVVAHGAVSQHFATTSAQWPLFKENVNDNLLDVIDGLREIIRTGAIPILNHATTENPGVTPDLLEACIQARAALPDAWFAVGCGVPVEVINLLNKAIDKAKSCGIEPKVTAKPTTSWAYNRHDRQTFLLWEGWQEQVTNEDTTRGYIEWVENQLDELLHETDLGGVDAIVVAGCTEADGTVDVSGEQKAELFSVYSHTLDTGFKCICDFNNKAQAIKFATALAARTKIPVYGNQCSIEGGAA